MQLRNRTLFACVMATIVVVLAPPATAESGYQPRKVGNAPAAIDITGIYANNGQNRVRIKLVVPGLEHKGRFTLGYETPTYDGMAIVVRHPDSGIVSRVFHCGEEDCDRVRCPRLKVHWNAAKNFVSASIPQSCYPFNVPDAWNFAGISDLGNKYDDQSPKFRLERG